MRGAAGQPLSLPRPRRLAIAARAGCQPARSLPSCPTKGQLHAVAALGPYDLAKIDVRGGLHQDIERELHWMGPMLELPNWLGYPR